MAGVKVSKEDEKFFYLQSPAGKELKVAKQGLGKERQEVYRSLISQPAEVPAQTPAPKQNDLLGDPDFNFSGRPERILSARELVQPQMTPVSANVPPNPLAGMQAGIGDVMTPARPAGTPEPDTTPNIPVGAGMPSMIPAQANVTETVVPGVPIDAELKKDVMKGFDLQAEAAKKQIEAQTDFQKAYAQQQAELQTQLAETNSQLDLIEQQREQAFNDTQAEFQSTIQKMQEAKIDPDRIYGGSTGKRVLAGIAIAMGAMGRALTGGSTNAALQIINNAIDRDIAAQEKEIQKLGTQASLQRQMLADIDTKYDNKLQAYQMKRAVMLDAAERKALQIAKNLTSQEAVAQAQGFIGQLQAQKAEALMKAGQMEADKRTIQTTTQMLSPAVAAGKSSEKAFDQASKLRQEYNKNAVTQETIKRKSSLNAIEAARGMDSAAGDLAFIFAYMKMLDPGSVVREGEFANAQNAAGVPDRIRNTYNRVMSGERLNENQRNDFFNTAKAIYNKQAKEQATVDKRYKGLAQRANIPVEDVIIFQPMEEKDPREISATFAPSGLGR